MNSAAIDNSRNSMQDDCSSVLSLRSRGLQMSMAASFAAHIAIGFYCLTLIAPAERPSLGDPKTLQVAFVDLAPMASSIKSDMQKILSKPTATSTPIVQTKVEEAKPLPLVEKANVVLKTVAPTKPNPKKAPDISTISASASHAPFAPKSNLQPQMRGAEPAKLAKTGEEITSDIVITNPRFRVQPKPATYPKRARELEQQGEALIRARLNYEGNTEEVLIWKSSGFVLLDNAALAAVRRWQFEPARQNGIPVVAWVQIPVRFTLN